jgi:hypothetical protein
VATDGHQWFVGSNCRFGVPPLRAGAVGVYGLDGSRVQMITPSDETIRAISAFVEDYPGDVHFGPPCWVDGTLLVPVQRPDGVWVLSNGLSKQEWWPAPMSEGLYSWLAVEPGSGRLYTSMFDKPTSVVALAWQTLEHVDTDIARGASQIAIDHVQGGAFTPNGRLLLSCNDPPLLVCVSALNGHVFGALHLSDVEGEVEGLTIFTLTVPNSHGHRGNCQVHVVDGVTNNIPIVDDTDEFYIRSYAVTAPAAL